MISRCPTPLATLVRLEADSPRLHDLLRESRGDALLVDCGRVLAGTFSLLGAASAAQRVLFPSRWIPAPSPAAAGGGDAGRLLAFARGDASLHRLFCEEAPELTTGGIVRPDEPLVLLGVAGDVLHAGGPCDSREMRRRAETWIGRLGRDRVALAVAAGDVDHPLAELALERDLPLVAVVDAEDPTCESLPAGGRDIPLLWTDFQLDREHRLPDESFVPGLRDLLHRGSLLQERVLYEHLPLAWREDAVEELRALHRWHQGPLLRRLAALLQTVAPVRGARMALPFPEVGGVCAYLLGLSDRRPDASGDRPKPEASARQLADALGRFDRRLRVRVDAAALGALQLRLSSWAEGGHLASCESGEDPRVSRFCFSGQPLWTRAPLRRAISGFPRVSLPAGDRRALGWFEIEVRVESEVGIPVPSSAPPREGSAEVLDAPMIGDDQLVLPLEVKQA